DAAADALVQELFLVGPAEVGLAPQGVRTLERVAVPLPPAGPAPLQPDDVVVISGGARGGTAQAARAPGPGSRPAPAPLSATRARPGPTPKRRPAPPPPPALTAEPDLKRELNRLGGGSLPPRDLGQRYRDLMAGRELRRNLARVAEAGGRVAYHPVDVRDAAA